MSELEKALVKEFAHFLVDQELAKFVDAEESKLPVAYQGLVKAATAAIMPAIQAAADKFIDAKLAPAAAPSA